MRTTLAVLAMLAPACVFGSSDAPGPTQGTLGDSSVRAKLREMGLQASSAAGVSSPRTMVAVASGDHQAAEQVVSGAIVNDHAPVYVVEMTGGPFLVNHSTPPGVPVAPGNVLTLTIDARSYRVTDSGIGPDAPDLKKIGAVVDLLAQ